jgi:flagellar hook-length control protein FliK
VEEPVVTNDVATDSKQPAAEQTEDEVSDNAEAEIAVGQPAPVAREPVALEPTNDEEIPQFVGKVETRSDAKPSRRLAASRAVRETKATPVAEATADADATEFEVTDEVADSAAEGSRPEPEPNNEPQKKASRQQRANTAVANDPPPEVASKPTKARPSETTRPIEAEAPIEVVQADAEVVAGDATSHKDANVTRREPRRHEKSHEVDPSTHQTNQRQARTETAVATVESDTAIASPAKKSSAKEEKVDEVERRIDRASDETTPTIRARTADGPRSGGVPQHVAAVVDDARLAAATNAAPTDATADGAAKKTTAEAKESLLTTFGRLERGGPLGARGSHRTGNAQDTPLVDPARFVNRVARAIHTAQERGGPLQLRLSPPELGSLRLELSVKQGVLTANVETDNANARQVLLDNLPALRERLAEQNVRIERFDVDVRREGSGDQPRYAAQQQDPHEQRQATQQNRPRVESRTSVGSGVVDVLPPRRSITDTSINVIA